MSLAKIKELKKKVKTLLGSVADANLMMDLHQLDYSLDDAEKSAKSIQQNEQRLTDLKELLGDVTDSQTAMDKLNAKIKSVKTAIANGKLDLKAVEHIESAIKAHERTAANIESKGEKDGKQSKQVNPWKAETFNLTQQGIITRDNRALAIKMAKEAGGELPSYLSA